MLDQVDPSATLPGHAHSRYPDGNLKAIRTHLAVLSPSLLRGPGVGKAVKYYDDNKISNGPVLDSFPIKKRKSFSIDIQRNLLFNNMCDMIDRLSPSNTRAGPLVKNVRLKIERKVIKHRFST